MPVDGGAIPDLTYGGSRPLCGGAAACLAVVLVVLVMLPAAMCTNEQMRAFRSPPITNAWQVAEDYDQLINWTAGSPRELWAHFWKGLHTNCIEPGAAASCSFPLRSSGAHTHLTEYGLFYSRSERTCPDASTLCGATLPTGLLPALLTGAPQFIPPGCDLAQLAALSEPLRATYGLPPPPPSPSLLLFEDVAHDVRLDIVMPAPSFAFADFNGDGLLDVMYSPWEVGNITVALSDGERFEPFEPHSSVQAVSVSQLEGGSKMSVADFNNDGHMDVFIARGQFHWEWAVPNSLLLGNGDGTFEDRTIESGLFETLEGDHAHVVLDWDLDGYLDIFICNEFARPVLLLGSESGVYDNVTEAVLPYFLGREIAHCRSAVTVDVNGDGLPDILAGLGDEYQLYALVNAGTEAPVEVFEPYHNAAVFFFSMVAADLDNDGVEEIVVGNHYGRSGSAVIVLRRSGVHYEQAWSSDRREIAANVMGLNVIDLNNDGFLDIVSGNGDPGVTSLSTDGAWLNHGGFEFESLVTHPGCKFASVLAGHTVCAVDLDNDGDQELVKGQGGNVRLVSGKSQVFRNHATDVLPGNSWLSVKLIGVESNRGAIGARVAVRVEREGGAEETVTRWAGKQSSYGCTPLRVHFGLGEVVRIVSLEVEWPSRSLQRSTYASVRANNFVVVREGAERLEYILY